MLKRNLEHYRLRFKIFTCHDFIELFHSVIDAKEIHPSQLLEYDTSNANRKFHPGIVVVPIDILKV